MAQPNGNKITDTLKNNNPKWLGKGYPLLWFAIIAFILFGQSLRYGYTYLDDQTLILGNMENLRSGSYLARAFSEDVFHSGTGHGFYYRPVLTLSFMLDASLGKGNLTMFHFSNILLHILAAFLLMVFMTETGINRTRSCLVWVLFLG